MPCSAPSPRRAGPSRRRPSRPPSTCGAPGSSCSSRCSTSTAPCSACPAAGSSTGHAVDLRRRALRAGRRRPGRPSSSSWSTTSAPTPAGWRSSRSASTTRPPSPCGRCDGCAGPWYADRGARPGRRCRPRAAGPGRRRPRRRGSSGRPAWTVSACRSRAGSRAEEALLTGRALARLSDLGWGQRLRELLREDAPASPELVRACVPGARRVGLGPAARSASSPCRRAPGPRWSGRSPRVSPRSAGSPCWVPSTSRTAGPPASRAATAPSGSPACGSGSSSGPTSRPALDGARRTGAPRRRPRVVAVDPHRRRPGPAPGRRAGRPAVRARRRRLSRTRPALSPARPPGRRTGRRPAASGSTRGGVGRSTRTVSIGRKSWTTGPDEQRVEHRADPDDAAEQRSPSTTTVTSSEVRTSRIERPVRRASPVISPSRGPGPSWLPMYIAPAIPLPRMASEHDDARASRAPRSSGTTASVASIATPDDDGVEHRAEPGPLAQRDPQQQHDERHDDAHQPVGHRDVLDQAVLQHAPRLEPELRPAAAAPSRPRRARARRAAGSPGARAGRPAAARSGSSGRARRGGPPRGGAPGSGSCRPSSPESGLGFDGQS